MRTLREGKREESRDEDDGEKSWSGHSGRTGPEWSGVEMGSAVFLGYGRMARGSRGGEG